MKFMFTQSQIFKLLLFELSKAIANLKIRNKHIQNKKSCVKLHLLFQHRISFFIFKHSLQLQKKLTTVFKDVIENPLEKKRLFWTSCFKKFLSSLKEITYIVKILFSCRQKHFRKHLSLLSKGKKVQYLPFYIIKQDLKKKNKMTTLGNKKQTSTQLALVNFSTSFQKIYCFFNILFIVCKL
ncbi:hypothetical protein RFI_36770 [Reticulomyxa filosa]|uniref:Uncharacterized protein n=1 Tax=Reticulomyxa filosa TaxID=46433 RepID=X6LIX5_RETFI|nr:hypothetical protein RFI_36770 [Reticulomyxa filosa]|eukprot:ETO00670.1 hypothetical protein RFI_36770 [Reticulomyxa filosa]